jgi:hypothetical protein
MVQEVIRERNGQSPPRVLEAELDRRQSLWPDDKPKHSNH